MKKIQIAISPLTGTIFAGHVLKEGIWATGKQDVTDDAISAVASHIRMHGGIVVMGDESGRPKYEVTVTEINDTNNS
jgi:hypothetical protein